MKNHSMFYIVSALLLVAVLIVFVPLVVIWALNTLFALSIAYTFWTWLSVVILTSVIQSRSVKK
jgi:hypothetical protein